MAAACCFDFSSPPVCVASNTAAFTATAAHHKSAVESGSCLPPNPFVQRVVFSPDGTCLLASADDNKLRVFEVPPHAFLPQRASVRGVCACVACSWPRCGVVVLTPPVRHAEQVEASKQQVLSPALGVQEGETVYDAAWYPLMHVTQPATCCFVTTTRERPIHLWDAFTGKVRCDHLHCSASFTHHGGVWVVGSSCVRHTERTITWTKLLPHYAWRSIRKELTCMQATIGCVRRFECQHRASECA